MNKVLYTGSFDPITKGHMDIIEQSINLFDEVIIAVLQNSSKHTNLFTLQERVEIIKELYKCNKKVKVITHNGAAVDVALSNNCNAIIRGLRNSTDYEYESQIARINKDISKNKINTIFLLSNSDW